MTPFRGSALAPFMALPCRARSASDYPLSCTRKPFGAGNCTSAPIISGTLCGDIPVILNIRLPCESCPMGLWSSAFAESRPAACATSYPLLRPGLAEGAAIYFASPCPDIPFAHRSHLHEQVARIILRNPGCRAIVSRGGSVTPPVLTRPQTQAREPAFRRVEQM